MGTVVRFPAHARAAAPATGIGSHTQPLSRMIAFDPRSNLFDDPHELVAQHDSLSVGELAMATTHDFHIRAANRRGAHSQQDLVALDLGSGDFANRERSTLRVSRRQHPFRPGHDSIAPSSLKSTGRR